MFFKKSIIFIGFIFLTTLTKGFSSDSFNENINKILEDESKKGNFVISTFNVQQILTYFPLFTSENDKSSEESFKKLELPFQKDVTNVLQNREQNISRLSNETFNIQLKNCIFVTQDLEKTYPEGASKDSIHFVDFGKPVEVLKSVQEQGFQLQTIGLNVKIMLLGKLAIKCPWHPAISIKRKNNSVFKNAAGYPSFRARSTSNRIFAFEGQEKKMVALSTSHENIYLIIKQIKEGIKPITGSEIEEVMKSPFISTNECDKIVQIPFFQVETFNNLTNIFFNLLNIKTLQLSNGEYVDISSTENIRFKVTDAGIDAASEVKSFLTVRGNENDNKEVIIDDAFSFSVAAIDGPLKGETFFKGGISRLEGDISGIEREYLIRKIIQMNDQKDFKNFDNETIENLKICFKKLSLEDLYKGDEPPAYQILKGPVFNSFLIDELSKKGIYEGKLPLNIMTGCATADPSFLKTLLSGQYKIKLENFINRSIKDDNFNSFDFLPLQLCIFLNHKEHIQIINAYVGEALKRHIPHENVLDSWKKTPKQQLIDNNDIIENSIDPKENPIDYIKSKIGKNINPNEYKILKKAIKNSSMDALMSRLEKNTVFDLILQNPLVNSHLINVIVENKWEDINYSNTDVYKNYFMMLCGTSDPTLFKNMLYLFSAKYKKNPYDFLNYYSKYLDKLLFSNVNKKTDDNSLPENPIQMCLFSGHPERIDIIKDFVINLMMQSYIKNTPLPAFKKSPQEMLHTGIKGKLENGCIDVRKYGIEKETYAEYMYRIFNTEILLVDSVLKNIKKCIDELEVETLYKTNEKAPSLVYTLLTAKYLNQNLINMISKKGLCEKNKGTSLVVASMCNDSEFLTELLKDISIKNLMLPYDSYEDSQKIDFSYSFPFTCLQIAVHMGNLKNITLILNFAKEHFKIQDEGDSFKNFISPYDRALPYFMKTPEQICEWKLMNFSKNKAKYGKYIEIFNKILELLKK